MTWPDVVLHSVSIVCVTFGVCFIINLLFKG